MPDKYHKLYLEEGIIDLLIDQLNSEIDSTDTAISKALTKLASKSNKYLYIYF